MLEAQSLGIREYLDRVLFYDAPSAVCQGATLAGMTEAGSRVIRVCGSRFARAMTENARYAEGVVIHEMLHSLGLGENPPHQLLHHVPGAGPLWRRGETGSARRRIDTAE